MPKVNVEWVTGCLKDLRAFPEDVQDEIGHALQKAQYGIKPKNAAPMRGFNGASVLAIKEDHGDGCTYRLVYTTRFPGWLFGLHAWKKKSSQGIATSKSDTDLINSRLKTAEKKHKEFLTAQSQVPSADQAVDERRSGV